MDDCFTESLVYSDSENSETEETALPPEINQPTPPSGEDLSKQNKETDDSDDDLNQSIKKTKKRAQILSSDDDADDGIDQNKSDGDAVDVSQMPESSPSEIINAIKVRPSICDSDTKSSSSEEKSEVRPQKMVKKLKKKKQKQEKQTQKHKQKQKRIKVSSLDSDSDDGSASEHDERPKKLSGGSDASSSGGGSSSSSESANSDSSSRSNDQMTDNKKKVKPREKPVQRMSAKAAREQMKEIQSETQRLARLQSISVPYHKPKQYSLKEFLSRRCLIEQQQKVNSKPVRKAAVAIKMSEEELIQYMEDLQKRTIEAEQFFQDEESDLNGKHNEQTEHEPNESINNEEITMIEQQEELKNSNELETKSLSPSSSPPPTKNAETLENETVDNQMDGIDNGHSDPILSNENERTEPTDILELHSVRTELDNELDGMKCDTVETSKLPMQTDYIPKLQGDKGFIIDFDSNDLKPAPKTGVDDLLTRFINNAIVKPHAAETQDVGIFQVDTGTVERHKVHLTLDDGRAKKEPKPGESLFKLRSVLEMKIKENREKIIAQRLQEHKEQEEKQKQMEIENEELEEFDEQIEMLNEELSEKNDDIDVSGDENIESNDSDSGDNDDRSESEIPDLDTESQKPRKRILTMDDSDDESQQTCSNNVPSVSSPIEKELQCSESLSTNMSLDEASKTMNPREADGPIADSQSESELQCLESEILKLNGSSTDIESSRKENSTLFLDGNENDEIGESQLMALCSGSFATQYLDKQSVPNESSHLDEMENVKISSESNFPNSGDHKETVAQSRLACDLESSDGEELENDSKIKSKNKKKKHVLIYSDDDESDDENQSDEAEPEENECVRDEEEISENEDIDDEEDPGEKYVEYDSDENEIHVELKKSDIRKKTSEYFENEAELSESDWNSEDEDEKGMNQYEAELGDADKFDKNKLRGELERIRLREQIDDDAREIRILTERFIEEEDNGQERERKFRWKHLNNGDLFDDQAQSIDQETITLQNDDDENEAEWRRIRYEREQVLKKQMNESDSVVERTSAVLDSTEKQTAVGNATTVMLSSTKRVSIVKPVGNVSSKIASPFLITKSDLNMGHLSRKSFLNRDSPILEKLAGMSKSGNDNDTIVNTAKGKGNYVFVASEKKDSSKRKSESENGDPDFGTMNPSKKSKVDTQKVGKIRPQTKMFFESLN